ncbi:MAG TPA: TlpA disulfide reductase family protein [Blastocatellia bacterium]|jgi:thiol-disulfide isomerase/thioredoxin|nr:TlpA disulfide reductase family protein [Blastocatellia bacterium]
MRAFLFTLSFLLGVTLAPIAQTTPAKANESRVIATSEEVAPHPSVIGAEPELALKDISGVERKLSALRGRIVVLNFWATWCGPCVKEMPELVAIQNQYAAFGVQVVGASLDTLAERQEVRRFTTGMKVNFPVLLGATNEDLARFRLGSSIPSTVVIGRDGKILAVFRGAVRRADLQRRLNALISSRKRR